MRQQPCWARDDSPSRTEVLAAIYANMWGRGTLSVPYWGNNWKQGDAELCQGDAEPCGGVCVLQPASTRSASSPPWDRLGQVWRARGGRFPPEWQSLFLFFSPQAPSKIHRNRLAFTHRCGGDHEGFQSWKTKIPFCLFTKSTGSSEKCLCAGLVRGSLNYSRSS